MTPSVGVSRSAHGRPWSIRVIIGHTIIRLQAIKPIAVTRLPTAFELNGHLITGEYGGTASHWPYYGRCHRCGESILGGADGFFAQIPCKRGA